MNKQQYNNVIDYTLKHDEVAQGDDSLATARAVFNNMGVALPGGTMKEVYDTIQSDDYMGWHSCTMQEAQEAANNGIAAIGISEDRIVMLSAADEEQPVTHNASVMVVDETTPAMAVAGMRYYAYTCGTTTVGILSQEQKHFISVVAGEAIGANSRTQKAVAHTIMNRVKEPRDVWSNATCVSDVLIKSQYNAIGESQYKSCMEYLDNRDNSNDLYETLIQTVLPIYLCCESDFTGGAHYVFNVETSSGATFEATLIKDPDRYVKCGPFADISDTKYRMYRCLW